MRSSRTSRRRAIRCRRTTQWLEKMIATLHERAKTLVELVEMARYYLDDEISYDEKAAAKFLTAAAADSMTALADKFAALDEFTEASIEHAFASTLARTWPEDGQTRPTRARRPDRLAPSAPASTKSSRSSAKIGRVARLQQACCASKSLTPATLTLLDSILLV